MHTGRSSEPFPKHREQLSNSAFQSCPWSLAWYLEDEMGVPAASLVRLPPKQIPYCYLMPGVPGTAVSHPCDAVQWASGDIMFCYFSRKLDQKCEFTPQ